MSQARLIWLVVGATYCGSATASEGTDQATEAEMSKQEMQSILFYLSEIDPELDDSELTDDHALAQNPNSQDSNTQDPNTQNPGTQNPNALEPNDE